MPTYEYECARCGVFEKEQRITDDPLKKCPKCRRKVTKLISATSFQLKGSGWYATDYASPSSGESKASKTPDSSPPKSDSGKKEAAAA